MTKEIEQSIWTTEELKHCHSADQAIKIINQLPHGSGIDSDWYISFNPDAMTCENSFHILNENGFYDGWVDFKVSIFWIKGKYDIESLEIDFFQHDDVSMLSDYLSDTIYHCLEEI